jgi:isoleucyl-tRNA synthetase
MKFAEYKGLSTKGRRRDLTHWKENQIFEKKCRTRETKPSYVFYEGLRKRNVGIHVMARTIKDIFRGINVMKGFQVKRKADWDTHGLQSN